MSATTGAGGITGRPGDVERVVYPGTFDPPTVGHLAIVEAVLGARRPCRVDLVVSIRPLLKEHVERPVLAHRIEVIEATFAHLDEVRVRTTEHRLIVDIAQGYDAVVMGADKWRQVNDEQFYADAAARDRAVAALPPVLVVGRGDDPVPDGARLVVDDGIDAVSSTRARGGEVHLMSDAARAFDRRTGAWTDPDRYDRWSG